MIKIEKGEDLQVWRDKINKVIEFINKIESYKTHFTSTEEDVPFDSQYFKEMMEYYDNFFDEENEFIHNAIRRSVKNYFAKHVPEDIITLNLLCQEYK